MATSAPKDVPKILSKTVKVIKSIRIPLSFGRENGHQIFVYSNIRTNQIVYSLTRVMQNKHAIGQLPFLGKNTIPPALRKDMWTPMCVISFPNAYQGLDAFQKLREFRKLHETAYPLSEITPTEGKYKGRLLPKKPRGIKLMNQRANSVADMAAVLAIQGRPPTEEQIKRAKFMVHMDKRPRAKRGARSKLTAAVLEFQGKLEGIRIWWNDQQDAEFAKEWPKEVEHGPLIVKERKPYWPPHPRMAFRLEQEESERTIEYQEGESVPDEINEEPEDAPYTDSFSEEPMSLKEKLAEAEGRMKAALPRAEKVETVEVAEKTTDAAATV